MQIGHLVVGGWTGRDNHKRWFTVNAYVGNAASGKTLLVVADWRGVIWSFGRPGFCNVQSARWPWQRSRVQP